MPAINISAFGGMIPARNARLLPPNAAANAFNVWLRSGAAEPLRRPSFVYRFEDAEPAKAALIVARSGETVWLPLESRFGTVLKAPIVNDLYERYYLLDPPGSPLRWNTMARILAGDPWMIVGVPAPAVTLTLTPPTGTPQETRAYVVTFVDSYGQESAPSEPVVASGGASGTWTLGGLPTSPPPSWTGGALSLRVYRTIVSLSGQPSYFRVAQFALGPSSYADTILTATVVTHPALESAFWATPRGDMEGIVAMPGGFFVGWRDRTLMFSEPYRPWAWQQAYDFSVQHPIVGCGVTGQTLVVATKGHPYVATGNTPAAMVPRQHDGLEPCISRASIVSGEDAVFYASPEGLVAASPVGVRVVTRDLIPKQAWRDDFAAEIIGAARVSEHFVMFTEGGYGFMLSAFEQTPTLVRLRGFDNLLAAWNERERDGAFLLVRDGPDSVVQRFDPSDASVAPLQFSWRSKEFVLPRPTNFAVAKVMCEGEPLSVSAQGRARGVDLGGSFGGEVAPPVLMPLLPPARIGMTSVIGYHGVGRYAPFFAEGAHVGTLHPGAEGDGWLGYPYWPGLAGVPSRDTDFDDHLLPGEIGRLRVFSNRVRVYDQPIVPNVQVRLPSGFRSDVYWVQVVSRVRVTAVQLATHGKELADV